mgnify:CR=1 FL=1
MYRLPGGQLLARLIRLIQAISRLQVPLYAANAGFFMILSVFPALVLFMSLLQYVGLEAWLLLDVLENLVPAALMETVEELVLSTYRSSTGTVVGLSAITALWSASRGIYGLITGLNAIYGVSEDRGYGYTRFISFAYTFAFLLVVMLTLVFHVFGSSLIRWLSNTADPLLRLLLEVINLRFFLLLLIQTLIFTLMFMVLPNRKNRFRDSLPGALLSSMGWLVFSDLYSVYVENFANLTIVYGSVYAIALTMLWLYFCLSIVFFGGALNRYLSDRLP